jgi:drug/metabolite transporter (DMT)-like permease
MNVFLALMSALAWGFQGFLLKFATTKTNTMTTMTVSYIVGVLGVLPLVWSKLPQIAILDLRFALLTLVAVGANTLAAFGYYRAIEVGNVAIVVPIVSCSGAVTLVLSLFSGESLSIWQILVILMIILGIIFSSRQPAQQQKQRTGVFYALLATLGYGLGLWIIGSQLRSYLEGDILSWILISMQLLLVGGFQVFRRIPFPVQGLGIVSLAGVVGVVGYVALTIALGNQQNGLVAIVGSLYGLVSVILARIFLREKLSSQQWVGVWLALVGVVLIAVVQ